MSGQSEAAEVAQQAASLQAKVAPLERSKAELSSAVAELREEHAALLTTHSDLQCAYSELSKQQSQLRSSCNASATEHRDAQRQLASLKAQLRQLTQQREQQLERDAADAAAAQEQLAALQKQEADAKVQLHRVQARIAERECHLANLTSQISLAQQSAVHPQTAHSPEMECPTQPLSRPVADVGCQASERLRDRYGTAASAASSAVPEGADLLQQLAADDAELPGVIASFESMLARPQACVHLMQKITLLFAICPSLTQIDVCKALEAWHCLHEACFDAPVKNDRFALQWVQDSPVLQLGPVCSHASPSSAVVSPPALSAPGLPHHNQHSKPFALQDGAVQAVEDSQRTAHELAAAKRELQQLHAAHAQLQHELHERTLLLRGGEASDQSGPVCAQCPVLETRYALPVLHLLTQSHAPLAGLVSVRFTNVLTVIMMLHARRLACHHCMQAVGHRASARHIAAQAERDSLRAAALLCHCQRAARRAAHLAATRSKPPRSRAASTPRFVTGCSETWRPCL